MNSRRAEAEQKRIEEEHIWFQAGYDACGTGLELNDWPRPEGPKYSRLWYRIKYNWQEGWKSGAGRPLSKYSPDESQINPQSINDKLFLLIRDKAPIRLRSLLQQFSSLDVKQVANLIREWEAQGAIKLTGTGKRGNPVIVKNAIK
jgi:hypothetical protein